MNTQFTQYLTRLGWMQVPDDTSNWIKVFTVNGKNITILAYIWCNKLDGYPAEARISPRNETELRPNLGNRRTVLKGKDRVICGIDLAGQMAAVKAELFGNKVAYFKNDARRLLHNMI